MSHLKLHSTQTCILTVSHLKLSTFLSFLFKLRVSLLLFPSSTINLLFSRFCDNVISSCLLGIFCPPVRAISSQSCQSIISEQFNSLGIFLSSSQSYNLQVLLQNCECFCDQFQVLIICFPDLWRRCRFLASRGSGFGPGVLHQLNKVVEQVFVNKKAFLNFFLKWSLDVFRSNFPWRLLFLFYSLPTNNTITYTPKANTLSCGYHIF